MTPRKSRRQILQAVASTTAVTATGIADVAAQPPVRVIEAGIRYEVPKRTDYDEMVVDSRPPYTVDTERSKFILDSSDELAKQVEGGEALVGEREAEVQGSTELTGPGNVVGALPLELSNRMRPKRAINLASKRRLPTVTVHWNSAGAAVTTESEGRVEVPTDQRKTIRLEPEDIDVTTRQVTDEIVEVEHVPEEWWGPKTEFGSATVEATPVVEVVDHGQLDLTPRELA